MKLNLLTASALAVFALTACQEEPTARISGVVSSELGVEGQYVYLFEITDSGRTAIDSARVEGSSFTFAPMKHPDSTRLVSVGIPRTFSTPLILEPGDIFVDAEAVASTGTPLNDALGRYYTHRETALEQLDAHLEELKASGATIDSLTAVLETELLAHDDSLVRANSANALSALILIDYILSNSENPAVQAHTEAWKKLMAPEVTKQAAVREALAFAEHKAETAAGKPYKDFSGVDDLGKEVKLSDFADRGHYTLVDFWASWCGPCRRAIPGLQEIERDYGPRGLQIVGVVVWDKMDEHLRVMQELKITWPQIFNEREAAELYGVRSIPHILLLDPQGSIVARNLHEVERIKAILEAEMTKTGGKL